MYKFFILLQKEFKESIKERRLIWLPIAFAGIGLIQPVMMKMLPLLADKAEGFIIDTSIVYTGNEIYSGVFAQFDQTGVIICAIILMGCICNEKNQGILEVMLSKQVGVAQYLLSKVVSYTILLCTSLLIGLLVGAYYSQVLFTPISWDLFALSFFSYLLWFMFVIMLGITLSCICKTQVKAAILTIVIAIVLVFVPEFTNVSYISPSFLTINAISLMNETGNIDNYLLLVIITIIEIVVLFVISFVYMKKNYRK